VFISISNTSNVPIYEQIIKQIKEQIISGTLAPGDPLPSIRNLAKELQISVITTKRAYEELEKEGFIVTLPGKGSFVSETNTEFITEQQIKKIEELIEQAVCLAKSMGLKKDEMFELLNIYFEGVE
jgi:GntR family transcriptional regulator